MSATGVTSSHIRLSGTTYMGRRAGRRPVGVRKVLGNDVLEDAADCSQGMSLEREEAWP